MIRRLPVAAVALVALLALPLVASAQDQGNVAPPRATSHVAFMMSGRVMTSWMPVPAETLDGLLGTIVALPQFVIGAQIKDLGIGAGINFYSWRHTSLFLFGPTVTYAILKSAGGRAQLHLVGSFSLATGNQDDGSPDGTDISALGFDFGVIGRAMILDNFGLDVGITGDYLQLTLAPTERGRDDLTDKGFQLVGFLGATFLL